MSESRISNLTPSFWTLQVGGWLAYGLLVYLTLLAGAHGTADPWALFVFKGVRTAIGFAVSLVLWRIYRVARARAVAGALGSAAGGVAWAVLYRSWAVWAGSPILVFERAELTRDA